MLKRNKLLAVIAIIVLVLASFTVYYYYFYQIRSTPEIGKYTVEYATPLGSSMPNAIAVDAHGDVWFVLQGKSSIAELNPANGIIHEYRLPINNSAGIVSWGMAVDNSRGLVWFTEQVTNSIWSFNVATHKFTQYPLKTPNAFPFGMAIDKQGNVWFTEFFGNKIGEITTSGNLSELAIPVSGDLEPSGITVDPSTDAVWFTIPGVNSTASYSRGRFNIQNLTGLADTPIDIAVDSHGNIWMTEYGSRPNFIAEFNPQTHYFKSISTSLLLEQENKLYVSIPYFCHVNQDGDVWFNEEYGNAMSEFIPQNNTLVEYFIPTRLKITGNISGTLSSTLSPTGQPWYSEFSAGKVGTVNTAVPLDVHLKILNYSGSAVTLPDGKDVSFVLSVSGSALSQVRLAGSVGNITQNFSFQFSPISGGIESVVTVHNNGSAPGTYFLTITALTDHVAVSQIIEVQVP